MKIVFGFGSVTVVTVVTPLEEHCPSFSSFLSSFSRSISLELLGGNCCTGVTGVTGVTFSFASLLTILILSSTS